MLLKVLQIHTPVNIMIDLPQITEDVGLLGNKFKRETVLLRPCNLEHENLDYVCKEH